MYTEETPSQLLEDANPRVARLLLAEKNVRDAGGRVMRLAGLYLPTRGAHMFYLKKGTVASRPDGVINQIHYEVRKEEYAFVCLEFTCLFIYFWLPLHRMRQVYVSLR